MTQRQEGATHDSSNHLSEKSVLLNIVPATASPVDPFLSRSMPPAPSTHSSDSSRAEVRAVVDCVSAATSEVSILTPAPQSPLQPSPTKITPAIPTIATSEVQYRGLDAVRAAHPKTKRGPASSPSVSSSHSSPNASARKGRHVAEAEPRSKQRRLRSEAGRIASTESDEEPQQQSLLPTQGDAVSDDEGDGGEAEEKALAAATVPHLWLVTDAFHVSLWYVLRYAGPALSVADLWACRALLSLTAQSAFTEEEKNEEEREENTTRLGHRKEWSWVGTEESELLLRLVLRKPNSFTARNLELRYGDWLHVHPTLEALARRSVLWWTTGACLTPSAQEEEHQREAKEEHEAGATHTIMSSTPMLELYDGRRVARLLLSDEPLDYDITAATRPGNAPRMQSMHQRQLEESVMMPPALQELMRVLQVVRGTELRLFLAALRHGSKAYAEKVTTSAEEEEDSCIEKVAGGISRPAPVAQPVAVAVSTGEPAPNTNSFYDAIPGRKRDMIRYFLERRYAVWVFSSATPVNSSSGGSSAVPPRPQIGRRESDAPRESAQPSQMSAELHGCCFATRAEEAALVSACWEAQVGPVYSPHAGLKAHLVWVTELFHVLTSNNGAGAVGQQGLKPLEATMTVAAPPTLLMVRPQLLLLLQALQSAREERRLAREAERREETGGAKSPAAASAVESIKKGGKGSVAVSDCLLTALLPSWPTLELNINEYENKTAEGAESSQQTQRSPPACASLSLPMEGLPGCDYSSLCTSDLSTAVHLPPPIVLFGSSSMMLEYRAALYTHRAVYEVNEGAVTAAQRYRGRNMDLVAHMHDTIMAAVRTGVAAVKQHPWKPLPSSLSAADVARFVCPVVLSSHNDSASTTSTVASVLYQEGATMEHLLSFTPLFRWYACLELLYPLLQSARRYGDANTCLHYLLYEPILVVHNLPEGGNGASKKKTRHSNDASPPGNTVLSPVTFAFRYRPHKRGEWLCRLAQNWSHEKRHVEALALLEEAQASYRELEDKDGAGGARQASVLGDNEWSAYRRSEQNPTAAALCAVMHASPYQESDLPPAVRRRGRMLRALWPTTTASSSGPAEVTTISAAADKALYHAAWEYVRDRLCRRHDRLSLERLLAQLHRRVRQWTPLPAHRESTTRQLADVPVWRIGGVRTALDPQLWLPPFSSSSSSPVVVVAAAADGVESSNGALTVEAGGATRLSPTTVELYTMQHFLRLWNAEETAQQQQRMRGGPTCVVGPRRQELPCKPEQVKPGGEELTRASPFSDDTKSKDGARWCAAHCEGQWIRCLAYALLWDCYWAYPLASASALSQREDPLHKNKGEDAGAYLWLSAFQDGPLDVTTPTQFCGRRRALAEARLRQLETWTRAELVDYVATHITMEGGNAPTPKKSVGQVARAPPETQVKVSTREPRPSFSSAEYAPLRDDGVDAPLPPAAAATMVILSEENSVVVLPPPSGKVEVTEREKEDASSRSPVPDAWRVPVGTLPLLDILRVIPLAPLWRLLRCLYLSPPTDGVPLRFSGFPDLIFWRTETRGVKAGAAAVAEEAPPFVLMEVKSPSDALSTKQIAVNELLHRCGFKVGVLRVDEVYDDGKPVSKKRLR